MEISKSELIEMKADKAMLDRFIEQTNNTNDSVEVSSLVGGVSTLGDLLWLVGKKLSKIEIVKFVIKCFRLTPRLNCTPEVLKTLEADERRMLDPSIESADVAAYAANFTDAYVANRAHAVANAYACAHADDYTYTATYVAAHADACAEIKEKINQYLIELFEG